MSIAFTLFLAYALGLSVALGRAGHRSRAPQVPVAARGPISRVLIIGATGGTGRELVRQALERGYAVTVLARSPAKLRIEHPQLTVRRGDVLDDTAVDAVVRGHDAVLSALGHRRYVGPTRILSNGTRHIVRAMQAHGVRRFICETSLGIGDSAGRMGLYYTFFVIPVVLPFYFWDKTRQERVIASSDLDWVIVRPGVLTDSAARGRYHHGHRVGSYVTTVHISRADVAAFMLEQLTSDTYVRTAPGVSW
ncbi:MAG: SDR family oxidoreductase [Acidobacteria bacterium]|nr:SDR family oxidoreductase [Acidobacteriota bacterium]